MLTTQRCFALLLTSIGVLTSAVSCNGYAGFDCSQGSAILQLTSHKCPSDVHQRYMNCFRSLALRVQRCSVKAWPHPHQGRKQGCGSLQLHADVTDVNHAHGLLRMHGSSQQRAVPVHLEYSRPDEAMHMRLGSLAAAANECVLVFDVRSASDASLHPIPGEDSRSIAAAFAVLVPAILVPCAVVALVATLVGMVRLRKHARWQHGSPDDSSYTLLDAEPGAASAGQPIAEAANCNTSRTGVGLGILKVMSRRARAKRMRRSCRPAYVGLPEQSLQLHRAYVAGRLQPGPFHLVAPFFKFPPVAMPPPLEAIPESESPTCSSASRASSSQDLSGGSVDTGKGSPVLDVEEVSLLQPDSLPESSWTCAATDMQASAADMPVGYCGPGWAWFAPQSVDAGQGPNHS